MAEHLFQMSYGALAAPEQKPSDRPLPFGPPSLGRPTPYVLPKTLQSVVRGLDFFKKCFMSQTLKEVS